MNRRGVYPILIAALALAGCGAMHGHGPHGADVCAEYRQTTAGKSIDEQRKAAEEHIVRMHGTADAAHVERHLRMMEQRCGRAGPPKTG